MSNVLGRVDLQDQLIPVGTSAVTVAGAIPINAIRNVYKLKVTEKTGSPNMLYIDGLLGTTPTVTAKDRIKLTGAEVQEYPADAIYNNTLPFWRFEQALFDHIQLTALNATIDVYIQYADEHA
jgi:hypothetical protein